jgi:hypothetical protein
MNVEMVPGVPVFSMSYQCCGYEEAEINYPFNSVFLKRYIL